jgi:uncharacterized protein (DUF1330 family)
MSAFYVFHTTIKDPDKFQIYAKSVGATLEPFGGKVLMRGKVTEVMAGTHDRQNVVILTFPDRDAALGWYRSDAYQALLPTRDAAADMTAICYEAPPS